MYRKPGKLGEKFMSREPWSESKTAVMIGIPSLTLVTVLLLSWGVVPEVIEAWKRPTDSYVPEVPKDPCVEKLVKIESAGAHCSHAHHVVEIMNDEHDDPEFLLCKCRPHGEKK